MKKLFITTMAVTTICIYSIAQKQYIPPTYSSNDKTSDPKEFNKDHIFVGGSLALGFGSYSFNVGATPEIGYSFNDWFDAGMSFNINYQSVRADPSGFYNNNTRQRSLNYGGGPFFRAYPLRQFFIQGQFEHNWIDYNYLYYGNNPPIASSFHTASNSFLAGIGFSQRIMGQSSFYTLLMIDLMTDQYSPYRVYNSDGSTSAIPVIRVGFDFYLHSKKR